MERESENVTPFNAALLLENRKDCPAAVASVLDWICDVIVKSNPQLGRSGPVCPFVMPALQLKCVWLSVCDRPLRSVQEVEAVVMQHFYVYEKVEPDLGLSSGLRTMVIGFTGLPEDRSLDLICSAHKHLKPLVVSNGLMLGEFHPASRSPGVHNPLFHALRSPLPLFVLRRMVSGDLIFLDKAEDPVEQRIEFLNAYLRVFGQNVSAEKKAAVIRTLDLLNAKSLSIGG